MTRHPSQPFSLTAATPNPLLVYVPSHTTEQQYPGTRREKRREISIKSTERECARETLAMGKARSHRNTGHVFPQFSEGHNNRRRRTLLTFSRSVLIRQLRSILTIL